MSIFNDDRRFGTDEEREEWMQEVKRECREDERKSFYATEKFRCWAGEDELRAMHQLDQGDF